MSSLLLKLEPPSPLASPKGVDLLSTPSSPSLSFAADVALFGDCLLTGAQSPESSSSSSVGYLAEGLCDDDIDMCQLVEEGLLEDVDVSGVWQVDEGKAALATRILENIDQLMDLEEWIKNEEPFNNWMEDKMVPLPTFGEVEPIPVPSHLLLRPALSGTHPSDTQSLLREFESVFDSVELGGVATLTPPQSPPYLQHQQQHQVQQLLVHAPIVVSQEMAEVEALVRSRVEDLVPSSPTYSSSSGSYSNAYYDVSSPSSSSVSEEDADYSTDLSSKDGSRKIRSAGRSGGSSSKPYGRNPEEKRSRKKEQNKNAATRYRQKKKAEVEEIVTEERGLMQQNDQLQTQVTDVQREIKYLKGLMRDLFKAKGLIQ